MRDLIPRQREFVRIYCGVTGSLKTSWHGTAAARAVGYSEATAGSIAHTLLRTPKVQAAIAEVIGEQQQQYAAIARRCIDTLSAIAFTDIDEVVDPDTGRMRPRDEISPTAMAAVSEIQVVDGERSSSQKVKLHSKIEAIRLLARMTGYLVDDRPGVNLTINQQQNAPAAEEEPGSKGLTLALRSRVRVALGMPADLDTTAHERASEEGEK